MVLIPGLLFAQNTVLQYNFYGPSQGLSANLVTSVQKDTTGFLWIGTKNGLNRFDGYSFQKFTPESTDRQFISNRYIEDLSPLRNHHFLITYHDNIDFFDILNPYTFELHKVNLYPANGVRGNVKKILVGADGVPYILTTQTDRCRIYQYQFRDTMVQVGEWKHDFTGTTSQLDFAVLGDQTFMINDSEYGLVSLCGKNDPVLFSREDLPIPEPFEYPMASRIFQLSRTKNAFFLSFARHPHVVYFDLDLNSWHLVDGLDNTPFQEYSYLWEDRAGGLLFSQTDGNGNYPITEHLFYKAPTKEPQNWDYLKQVSQYIVSLYSDDFQKTIHLGADTGLKIYQNNHFNIDNFLAKPIAADEFGAVMKGITYGLDGDVYLAREYTYWYRLNERTGKLDTLQIRTEPEADPINFRCSYDILYRSYGQLWGIACRGNGNGLLIRYDLESDLATVYEYPHRFYDLIAGNDGYFWLIANGEQGNNSLVRFDPDQTSFEPFTTLEQKNPFRGLRLNCLFESQSGQIWIGTDRGLYRVNTPRTQVSQYTPTEQVRGATVRTIAQDEYGQLWIGSSEGVTVLDEDGALVFTLSEKDGMSNDNISTIVEDRDGKIWISTDGGLNVWLPEQKTFRHFYANDGFAADLFTTNSGILSPNNYLYFGSVNGFSRFKPESVLTTDSLPPPRLSEVEWTYTRSDSVQQIKQSWNPGQAFHMYPKTSSLRFSFFLPHFSNPQRNQFRTRLWPFQKEWVDQGTENSVRYHSLPDGRYTLQVQAAGPSGQWGKQVLAIPLIVHPNWYNTNTAYIGFAIMAALLGYLLFRYRLNQRLRVERFRTKLSSDIHDEVSGLLSGIALQSDLLAMKTKDPENRSRSEHISDVSRKAASKLHDVIWSIDSRKDHLADLQERMQEHAEDVFQQRDIQFHMQLEGLDLRQKVPVVVRQNLFFLYKEAINNVGKHSNATQVKVLLKADSKSFTMRIQDNGMLDEMEPHKKSGQGIENMEMRAKRLGAKLSIDRQAGYTIHLKMKKF